MHIRCHLQLIPLWPLQCRFPDLIQQSNNPCGITAAPIHLNMGKIAIRHNRHNQLFIHTLIPGKHLRIDNQLFQHAFFLLRPVNPVNLILIDKAHLIRSQQKVRIVDMAVQMALAHPDELHPVMPVRSLLMYFARFHCLFQKGNG